MIGVLSSRKWTKVLAWEFSIEMTTSKKVKDNNVYKDVNFKQTIVLDLVDKGNKSFKILQGGKCITEKELKHFSYQFKKTSANYTFCQKFISVFLMYLGDLYFPTVALVQKKCQNSLIFIAEWLVLYSRL